MKKLNIKKLHPDALMPAYASDGAACFDLFAAEDGFVDTISHTSDIIPTGLAFEIPSGWAMLIFSRSGHGFKSNVRLANCVGVIDSDYRGQVMIKLTADDEACLAVKAGDRIAQAMLVPVENIVFSLVDELSHTTRGAGGFGSTGSGAL